MNFIKRMIERRKDKGERRAREDAVIERMMAESEAYRKELHDFSERVGLGNEPWEVVQKRIDEREELVFVEIARITGMKHMQERRWREESITYLNTDYD